MAMNDQSQDVKVTIFGCEHALTKHPERLGLVCMLGGGWELSTTSEPPHVLLDLVCRNGENDGNTADISTDFHATHQEAADALERLLRPLARMLAHPIAAAIPDGLAAMADDVDHQIDYHADTVPRFLRETCKVVVEADRFFCLTDYEMDRLEFGGPASADDDEETEP